MATSTLHCVVLRSSNCGIEEKDWAYEEEEDNTTVNTTSSCVTLSHSNVTNSHIAMENAARTAAIASANDFLRSLSVGVVNALLDDNLLVSEFRRRNPRLTAAVITDAAVIQLAEAYLRNIAIDSANEFLRSLGVGGVDAYLYNNLLVSAFRRRNPRLTAAVITDAAVIQLAQDFVQQAPPVPLEVAVGQGGGDDSSVGSGSHGRRDAGGAAADRQDLMQQPLLRGSNASGAALAAASSSSGGTAGAAGRAAQAMLDDGAILSTASSIQNFEPLPVAAIPPRRGENVEAEPEEIDNIIAGGQPVHFSQETSGNGSGPVAGAAASHAANDSSQEEEEDQKPSASKKQRRE